MLEEGPTTERERELAQLLLDEGWSVWSYADRELVRVGGSMFVNLRVFRAFTEALSK